MRGHHERLAAKHPSVGATRNLGLFGIIDLVRSRDPWTPLTPFNGTSDEMKAIGKFLRDERPVHDARQQLDPHEPAAVHHRGPAGRGLRDHRSRPSTSPTRRSGLGAGVPMPVRTLMARAIATPPRPRPIGRGAGGFGRSIGFLTVLRHPARRLGGRQGDRRRPLDRSTRCWGPASSIDWTPPFQFAFATRRQAAPHLGHRARVRRRRRQRRRRRSQRLLGAALFTLRNAAIGFALGVAAGPRRWRSCSSTSGCSSARSCRSSWPARRSRSSPSRRSSSSGSRRTGSASRSSPPT